MKNRTITRVIFSIIIVATVAWIGLSNKNVSDQLTVAISPYQDLAMLINIQPLQLEKKYGTKVRIVTIPWEETYPSVLSASKSVDVAFSSFADYLSKYERVNKDSNDPLLFVYPAYVFKGGAFVSFDKDAVRLTRGNLSDTERINKFLDQSIALQKTTLYEMIILHLAYVAHRPRSSIRIIDVGFDAGFLAAVNGDVNVAAVGLTQLTEAEKRGASVVLNMDELGFADITGFITKRSTLEMHRKEVENVIRMWFDCVNYVLRDVSINSKYSLDYLKTRAATRYTAASYEQALRQEYFPRNILEVQTEIIQDSGKYSAKKIYSGITDFLFYSGIIAIKPPFPEFVHL